MTFIVVCLIFYSYIKIPMVDINKGDIYSEEKKEEKET